ncbi:MAG: glycosyl transferase family 2, partial [Vicinamibacteria bacterium]
MFSAVSMGDLVLALYFAVLTTLAIFGVHRYRMVYLYFRNRRRRPELPGRFATLPRVTIQLPVYNELYVVSRLIDSVCRLDYPGELLEIQVLD